MQGMRHFAWLQSVAMLAAWIVVEVEAVAHGPLPPGRPTFNGGNNSGGGQSGAPTPLAVPADAPSTAGQARLPAPPPPQPPAPGLGGTTPGQGGRAGLSGGAVTAPPRPSSPAGAGATGGLTRGSTTPSKGRAASFEHATTWHWWWQFNRERFEEFVADAGRSAWTNVTPNGSDPAAVAAEVVRDRQRTRSQVATVLVRALRDVDETVRAEAVFALGRAGSGDHLQEIEHLLGDDSPLVRRHALLALGLTGDVRCTPTLIEVLRDSPAGRLRLGMKGSIDEETRVHAAMALGYLGSRGKRLGPTASEALADAVESRTGAPTLCIAAASALGLMRDAAAAPRLLACLNDPSRNESVRSVCANVLGKIGDRGALSSLLAALGDRSDSVRRSAAIAIGLVAVDGDRDIVSKLSKVARSDGDRATRNFAIIALGEIGGSEAKSILVRTLKSPTFDDQTFAALALGILCSKHADSDTATIGALLLTALDDCRECPRRGALVLALGMMRYEPAAASLIEEMRTHEHPDLRVVCARALGLMRSPGAVESLVDQLHDPMSPDVRSAAAMSLGMIGTAAARSALTAEFMSDTSVALGAVATRSLGRDGEATVLRAFTGMLAAPGKASSPETRAFAATALGLIADDDTRSASATLARDSNYISQYYGFASLFDRI